LALQLAAQSWDEFLEAASIALSIKPFQPNASPPVTAMLTPAPQTSRAFPLAIAAFKSSTDGFSSKLLGAHPSPS
jgi:hypothetical protein